MDRLTLRCRRLSSTSINPKQQVVVPLGETLPEWWRLPGDDKLPVAPCPKNAFVLCPKPLGEKIKHLTKLIKEQQPPTTTIYAIIMMYINTRKHGFDLTDPNNYLISNEYNPLNDPGLKTYFTSTKKMKKHLIDRGFITEDGKVICSPNEFNKYRKFLNNIFLFDIHKERRLKDVEALMEHRMKKTFNFNKTYQAKLKEVRHRALAEFEQKQSRFRQIIEYTNNLSERLHRERLNALPMIQKKNRVYNQKRYEMICYQERQHQARKQRLFEKWSEQEYIRKQNVDDIQAVRTKEQEQKLKDFWESKKVEQREKIQKQAELLRMMENEKIRNIQARNRVYSRQREYLDLRIMKQKETWRHNYAEREKRLSDHLRKRVQSDMTDDFLKSGRQPFKSLWSPEEVLRKMSFTSLDRKPSSVDSWDEELKEKMVNDFVMSLMESVQVDETEKTKADLVPGQYKTVTIEIVKQVLKQLIADLEAKCLTRQQLLYLAVYSMEIIQYKDQTLQQHVSSQKSSSGATLQVLDEFVDFILDRLFEEDSNSKSSSTDISKMAGDAVSASLGNALQDIREDVISDDDLLTLTVSLFQDSNEYELDSLVIRTLQTIKRDLEEKNFSPGEIQKAASLIVSSVSTLTGSSNYAEREVREVLQKISKDLKENSLDAFALHEICSAVMSSFHSIQSDGSLDGKMQAIEKADYPHLISNVLLMLCIENIITGLSKSSSKSGYIIHSLEKILSDLKNNVVSEEEKCNVAAILISLSDGSQDANFKKKVDSELLQFSQTLCALQSDALYGIAIKVVSYYCPIVLQELELQELLAEIVKKLRVQLKGLLTSSQLSALELCQILWAASDKKPPPPDVNNGIHRMLVAMNNFSKRLREGCILGVAMDKLHNNIMANKANIFDSKAGMLLPSNATKSTKRLLTCVSEQLNSDKCSIKTLRCLTEIILPMVVEREQTDSEIACNLVGEILENVKNDFEMKTFNDEMLTAIGKSVLSNLNFQELCSDGNLSNKAQVTLKNITDKLHNDQIPYEEAERIFAIILNRCYLQPAANEDVDIPLNLVENLVEETLAKIEQDLNKAFFGDSGGEMSESSDLSVFLSHLVEDIIVGVDNAQITADSLAHVASAISIQHYKEVETEEDVRMFLWKVLHNLRSREFSSIEMEKLTKIIKGVYHGERNAQLMKHYGASVYKLQCESFENVQVGKWSKEKETMMQALSGVDTEILEELVKRTLQRVLADICAIEKNEFWTKKTKPVQVAGVSLESLPYRLLDSVTLVGESAAKYAHSVIEDVMEMINTELEKMPFESPFLAQKISLDKLPLQLPLETQHTASVSSGISMTSLASIDIYEYMLEFLNHGISNLRMKIALSEEKISSAWKHDFLELPPNMKDFVLLNFQHALEDMQSVCAEKALKHVDEEKSSLDSRRTSEFSFSISKVDSNDLHQYISYILQEVSKKTEEHGEFREESTTAVKLSEVPSTTEHTSIEHFLVDVQRHSFKKDTTTRYKDVIKESDKLDIESSELEQYILGIIENAKIIAASDTVSMEENDRVVTRDVGSTDPNVTILNEIRNQILNIIHNVIKHLQSDAHYQYSTESYKENEKQLMDNILQSRVRNYVLKILEESVKTICKSPSMLTIQMTDSQRCIHDNPRELKQQHNEWIFSTIMLLKEMMNQKDVFNFIASTIEKLPVFESLSVEGDILTFVILILEHIMSGINNEMFTDEQHQQILEMLWSTPEIEKINRLQFVEKIDENSVHSEKLTEESSSTVIESVNALVSELEPVELVLYLRVILIGIHQSWNARQNTMKSVKADSVATWVKTGYMSKADCNLAHDIITEIFDKTIKNIRSKKISDKELLNLAAAVTQNPHGRALLSKVLDVKSDADLQECIIEVLEMLLHHINKSAVDTTSMFHLYSNLIASVCSKGTIPVSEKSSVSLSPGEIHHIVHLLVRILNLTSSGPINQSESF